MMSSQRILKFLSNRMNNLTNSRRDKLKNIHYHKTMSILYHKTMSIHCHKTMNIHCHMIRNNLMSNLTSSWNILTMLMNHSKMMSKNWNKKIQYIQNLNRLSEPAPSPHFHRHKRL